MTDLPEYADLVGCPVEVQFVKGGAGPSTLTGNLYTVDPISNDLVVITFSSDKSKHFLKNYFTNYFFRTWQYEMDSTWSV